MTVEDVTAAAGRAAPTGPALRLGPEHTAIDTYQTVPSPG
jgi:hypothetical protein